MRWRSITPSTIYRLRRCLRVGTTPRLRRFTFAVKASRFISHMKKPAEPELHVARFLSHAAELREKIGVALFQLPPFWKFNVDRLSVLLGFVAGQVMIPRLRMAVELRHPSWQCDECFEILRHYGAALVLADWPGCTTEGPLTTDFIRALSSSQIHPAAWPACESSRK